MNSSEIRSILSLGSILSFRMLGLFMIVPIFTLYAQDFSGSNATLIGVALGIYGLTQACLQIPFGILSDRYGRKQMIFIGLLLFGIGSLICAMSHSIYGIILGRAFQGMGAIGSVCIASVADNVRIEHRTKAMAIMGLIIGLSFFLAMTLGPVISASYELSGVFYVSCLFAVIGIVIVLFQDFSKQIKIKENNYKAQLRNVLSNRALLKLDFGIFLLHCLFTASFVAIPVMLANSGVVIHQQWQIYLGVTTLAILMSIPFIYFAERKHLSYKILSLGILIMMSASLGLSFFHNSTTQLIIELVLFFVAFNLLEASIPAMVTKVAPIDSKGTAMGVYSTSQFLGIFVGGILGGWIYHHYQASDVFILCSTLCFIWLLIMILTRRQDEPLVEQAS